METGLILTLVGLVVVFAGLGGLSLIMFLISKNSNAVKSKDTEAKVLREEDIAVIGLAIYLTKLFNEHEAIEFRVKHKTSSAWFLNSRLNGLFTRRRG